MKRLLPPLVIALSFITFQYSCDEDPSSPPPAKTECLLGTTNLSFDAVCIGDSTTRSFNILAPGSNTGNVTGTVSGGCQDFTITSGEGPYKLTPGQTWTVEIMYKPSMAGSTTCVITTGTNCGDVTCTVEGEDCALCALNVTSLDFGDVCVGETILDSFVISAAPDNRKPVTGSVSSTCSDYVVTSGNGPFTLHPGENLQVTVGFTAAAAGTSVCVIETASSCGGVPCTGIGATENAYLELIPLSRDTFEWRSNFLQSAPTVYARGLTWDDPPWNNCPGEGWTIAGSASLENGIGLQDIEVPRGARNQYIGISWMADWDGMTESECLELLFDIDGIEYTWELIVYPPMANCNGISWGNQITPGVYDIFFGINDSATCHPDMRIWYRIRYEFTGACVSSPQVYSGQGQVNHMFMD